MQLNQIPKPDKQGTWSSWGPRAGQRQLNQLYISSAHLASNFSLKYIKEVFKEEIYLLPVIVVYTVYPGLLRFFMVHIHQNGEAMQAKRKQTAYTYSITSPKA